MAQPTVVSYSRSYPVPVEQAFDSVLSMPLEQMFARRHGPIPAVRGTVPNQPTWESVGDSRTIRLADGGSLREELTRVERPAAFGYELTDIRGPMKPLAARIEGLFTFEAEGSGTRITWSWALYPRTLLSRPILPVFGRIWQGSARKAFDNIGTALPTA
jgi:hypothetical protein